MSKDVTYTVKDKDGNIILEPGKIAEYFEELLNIEGGVEYEEQEEVQQQEINIEENLYVLRKLR